MKPAPCAEWEGPLAIETTAMMRRNKTSRRVHALSSGSIRSDEIAATDMALSRDCSRVEPSDIGLDPGLDLRLDLRLGAHKPEKCRHVSRLGLPRRADQ